MQKIRLERGEWSFDETQPLGPAGGFGEVFNGVGPSGPVAVKRLRISAAAAAHRELSIGEHLAGRSYDHVVPILDAGQDAESDRYFIIMPVCDRSLQDEIAQRGALPADEVRQIALSVLAGLAAVGEIVHRDLKPGNILLYNEQWCIADFGIAKFVEDSTSLETLRHSLTPAFGAPEQWEGDRPTHATDVYALGCIIHAMATAMPPFVGSEEDIRSGHLTMVPPPLPQLGNRQAAFVSLMLRKSPASRPAIARCTAVFSEMDQQQSLPARAGLEAAAHHVAMQTAAAEAARLETQAREREWERIVSDGVAEMSGIRQRLIEEVRDASDEALRNVNSVSLGKGSLTLGDVTQVNLLWNDRSDRPDSSLTIAGWCYLSVTTEGLRVDSRLNAKSSYTWAATLVFAKTSDDPTFRWREISFYSLIAGDSVDQPFGINGNSHAFDLATTNSSGEWRVAFGPVIIDGEAELRFQERWMSLLAKAAIGKLDPPMWIPFQEEAFM